MKAIFSNWNIWRIARLILGILVINEAGADNSFVLYMVGGFLFFHALLNIKCGPSGCNVIENKQDTHEGPVIKTRKLDLKNYK